MSRDHGRWGNRTPEEYAAAEKYLEGVSGFAPHDGDTSDINLHAADLLDDPDPEFDPARRDRVETTCAGPFRVEGYYDNPDGLPVAYTVDVDPEASGVNGVIVHGMPTAVVDRLRIAADLGQAYPLAALGSPVPVDLADPAGVFAGLCALTEVARTSGAVPRYADDEPGTLH